MDVRAINLRLGDAVDYPGTTIDTVKRLEIVGNRVEVQFRDDAPDDFHSFLWNETVHVLDYERKMPESPAAPRPKPKPRAPKMWG